jgi:hypothetical protein
MEPMILAVAVGSLTAVKSMLQCVEILVRARADTLRERARMTTILAVMPAMRASNTLAASVEETAMIARKPKGDRTPGTIAVSD